MDSSLNHEGGYECLNFLPSKRKKLNKAEQAQSDALNKVDARLTKIQQEVDEWLSIHNDAFFK